MNLPIEIIPNTNPPQFKWKQVVNTINGTAEQECSGLLPPSIDNVVKQLLFICKSTIKDNIQLQKQVLQLQDQLQQLQQSQQSQQPKQSPTPQQQTQSQQPLKRLVNPQK